MDKYEYKIRSEEIKSLIAKGEYADAAAIADTIDWRRVKSVMMLCTVSDLYKINRRYEDARALLLLAYDRHPGGRSIVYSLCELCIKMDDFLQAVEYYKEFVQVAPKDSGRYVLQYKLYEAQEVSLEERIEVLEELKAKDYSEKWAYELAYLYHRVGLTTRCVEECDELILWFGEGRYVVKAMELKQLHEPLTEAQQEKYEVLKGLRSAEPVPVPQEQETDSQTEEELLDAPTREIPQDELDIQVKLMNVGQYDTINIQKELAQNMKELLESGAAQEPSEEKTVQEEVFTGQTEQDEHKVEEVFFGETGELDATGTRILEEMKREALEEKPDPEESKEEERPEEKAVPEEKPQVPLAAPDGDMRELHGEKKPDGFARILGMESDGQISMVVPESEQVEKQITGQISLEDVLLEWERMKKDSEQKRKEAVRQHVMQQTGAMFTEFEAAARDGLLEKLEKGTLETAEAATEELSEGSATEEFSEEEETGEAFTEEASMEGTSTEEPGEESSEEPAIEEFSGEEEIEEALTEEVPMEGTSMEEPGEELSEEPAIEEAATEQLSEEAATEEFSGEEETGEAFTEEDPMEGTSIEEPAGEEMEEEAPSEETGAWEPLTQEEQEEAEGEDALSGEAKPESSRQHSRRRRVRPMSAEEKQSFGSFAQNRNTRDQIVYAIDNISMAAYTGNIIVTGDEGMDTLTLAKKLIQEVQLSDSNFSGKIAKISGESLNRKGIAPIFEKLVNGALIVQHAGELSEETVEEMIKALDQENSGMIVVLEDTRKNMHKLLRRQHRLTECFNIEINVEAMDNDSLVAYAKTYAGEQEYSIDELGILALHTRIAERQTSDHAVTPAEVKEMVDQAIYHANRKTLGHFFDILIAKRYDEEDMIILREKDFM